jgi:aminopeptidase YwaD
MFTTSVRPALVHRRYSTFRLLSLSAAAMLLLSAFAPATVGTADPQRYLADVTALASPQMEGRGAGTKGLTRAAKMLEARYRNLGLKPAGTNGYLQPFSVITGAKLKGKNHFLVHEGDAKTELKMNEEYVPFSFSESGVANSSLVFAGYGATADDFQYDDYAHLDVQDKIVVVLRYEPPSFAVKGGNHGLTQHSQLITKAINARNHGAKALILINGKLGDGEDDLLTKFGSVSGPENIGILFVQVKNAVAGNWFKAAGKSLADVQSGMNSSSQPASFAFPQALHASINVSIESTRARVNNVLAYLPGKTDEYIVIGAHYDHLGRGNFDSLAPSQIGQIHPGADDNASGTAGVLELARMFAPQAAEMQRGVLFMSFAGEELGLLGSAHWVNQPTLPLDKAVAMLNMDMIGRIKDSKVYIGGVGTGSSFKSLLEEDKSKTELNLEFSAGGYAASDHTSFVSKKIPVLFFFSGLHSDYHKPSDTADKINAKDAAQLLGLVATITQQLDDAPQRVAFQTVMEEKPMGGVSGGGGYGPYFGSIPDFGQTENGVKFSDVKPSSPAAKAGLKAGDVLVQFGDKPIKNLYDFTDALRRSKVGDVVQVTVTRDGKPITVPVKLEQRK